MKRSPIALLPWMVLATAAYGQTRSADVLYTHHDDVPTRGLRVADECFVSLEDAKRWGWQTSTWADTADVKAEGKSVAVPFRVLNGRQMIPLRAAIKKLGGDTEWVGNTDTLAVFGSVTSVTVKDGKLRLQSSMQFRPRTTLLMNPTRLVIDLEGVRLAKDTKLDLESTARMSQYKPNVARLIVQTEQLVDLDKLNGSATSDLQFEFPAEEEAPEPERDPVTTPPTTTPPTLPDAVPTSSGVLEVRVESETSSTLNLKIPVLPKGEPIFRKPDATTLEVVLPGLALTLPDNYQVSSATIVAASAAVTSEGTVLTLKLARPVGAQVFSTAEGVKLEMQKPNVGNGKLAGKLIVVDPGHGGHDRGANAGGVFEKDLNLKIGTLIAQELAKAGATVIMTRKTDVFIPLNERAKIAERNHADLFISSHINSTGGSGSQSGGITFHHLGRPVSRVLAECIQAELAKVGGIPDRGVWSDGKIYRTGFAVLRQTTMPGVLLELGFINHPRDRKRLVQDDFQHGVAEAVVRGIKVFLGDAKKND